VTESHPKERELWLQLACLAVSVGLHAALAAVGWQGLGAFAESNRPIVVILGAQPASALLRSGPTVADARKKHSAVAPLRREVSVPLQINPPVMKSRMEDPIHVVPEAVMVVETTVALPAAAEDDHPLLAEGEHTGGGSLATGGAGSMSSLAMQGDGLGQDAGKGDGIKTMIRATPRYEFNPKPEYPGIARQNRWEGTVRVQARVTAAGAVESVSLERSSGYAALDRSALDSVRRWRFIPATDGGTPVVCDVSIPVAFKLTE
jgi:protein TonB